MFPLVQGDNQPSPSVCGDHLYAIDASIFALTICAQRAVLTGRGRDDECIDFSGFSLQPTNWQASIQPVRLALTKNSVRGVSESGPGYSKVAGLLGEERVGNGVRNQQMNPAATVEQR